MRDRKAVDLDGKMKWRGAERDRGRGRGKCNQEICEGKNYF